MMNYEDTQEETKLCSSTDLEECKSESQVKCSKDICKHSWPKSWLWFDSVFSDDFLFEQLLDFFNLDEIIKYFYLLNKSFKARVNDANYLLTLKFADKLNITPTFLTSDLAARDNILDIYRAVSKTVEEAKIIDLKPNWFYTDSGIVGTNMWYGMHNIFETNTTMYYGYVFSSNKGTNNHIMAYLCAPGGYNNTFNQKLKSEFELSPGSKDIKVPYKTLPADGTEATFKVPRVFEINCRNQGYWYYVDNLMLLFSENEVNNDKFQKSTKFFNNFKWAKDVTESGIPILSTNTETAGFTIIEFDLSKKAEIMKIMGIKKFVSIPLVYIYIDKNTAYGKTLKYTFSQPVAAKYMSMKLLCWSTNQYANQLDMFPWVLKGVSLNFD